MAVLRPLVLACALLGATQPARAWTETRVEGMRAHLELAGDGSALVSLRIRIRVLGGWLSRFDLRGLDPTIALDPDKPPWLVSESGQKFAPKVEVLDGGELRLRFSSRHDAPRRGRHEIGLLYRAQLPLSATSDGRASRASWTLPAWPVGLENVAVTITAPAGSSLLPPEDLSERAAVSIRSSRHGSRTLHRLRRVHLPRTVAWTLRLELPSHAPAAPSAPASATSDLHAPHDLGELWGALALALLALLKLASHGSSPGATPRMLIPALGPAARATAIVASAAASALAENRDLALAMLALCVALALARGGEPTQGETGTATATRPAQPPDLARARRRRLLRWAGPSSWLYVTTPAGLLLFGTLWSVIGLALQAGAEAESFVAAGLLSSALLVNRPQPDVRCAHDAALLRLAKLALSLARHGIDSELQVASTSSVPLSSAGPRLVLRLRGAAGLHSLELRAVRARWLDRSRPALAFVARARPGSTADRYLAEAMPGAQVQTVTHSTERRAFTRKPLQDALALAAWLRPAALRDAA